MRKCWRKLKLVDFGWYFVVLTSGFYLTALTTVPHPSRFMEKKAFGGVSHCGWKTKQGQVGKLHVPPAQPVP